MGQNKATRKGQTNMGITVEEKVYELPSEDSHRLEVVKIGELKTIQTSYGPKEKFSITIKVLDEVDSKGEPLNVFMNVSPSIGVKATLGKFLRRLKWNLTGKVQMDDLLGTKFKATVAHNAGTGDSAGKTFANILVDSVVPMSARGPAPVETV